MPTIVRRDDWETEQQYDAVVQLAETIDNTGVIADALKTSGAGYKLTLGNFADDAAAATGGVLVGQLYRTGSVVKVRVS